MNVLIIPSWYPTLDFPITGIFIKEQVMSMADAYPEHHFAVSLWGSHDRSLWLDSASFYRLSQKWRGFHLSRHQHTLTDNCQEYFSPAFTWTRKWKQGNMANIIRANRNNLMAFQAQVGKIDIIHAHVSHPAGVIAQHLSGEFGMPYILTEHMGPFPFKSLMKKNGAPINAITDAIKSANEVVAVSQYLGDRIANFTGRQPLIIPNLTDEAVFRPKAPPLDKRIIFVGRLVREKGLEELLSVWMTIKERYEGWQLEIIGDGPLYRKVTDPTIIWKGELTREHISASLGSAAFLVLPSHYDNNPLVIIEAMACGVPVLASRVGGIPEMISEQTGRIIPAQASKALEEGLAHMIDHHASYDRPLIRDQFLSKYARGAVTRQLMALYHRVIPR